MPRDYMIARGLSIGARQRIKADRHIDNRLIRSHRVLILRARRLPGFYPDWPKMNSVRFQGYRRHALMTPRICPAVNRMQRGYARAWHATHNTDLA